MTAVTLSKGAITALQKVITGDNLKNQDKAISPYQTRGELISFFVAIPGLDVRDVSLGTRRVYVETVLEHVNGTEALAKIIEAAVHPLRFETPNQLVADAVDYLNKYLEYDGHRLSQLGRTFKLRTVDSDLSVAEHSQVTNKLANDYLVEQLEKSEARLEDGDY